MVPPPQLPVRPFGVETTNPPGRVSLKPTPVRVVVVLLFCIVNCRLFETFSGMLAAPNAFMITGGPTTLILAFDVMPVPPSLEVTWTLLFFTPTVVPVTLTETLQLAPEASVPPARLTEPDAATAVAVPPHVFVRAFGVATTSPAGRVSVKAMPVRLTFVFGLLMLKVRLVVPFRGMLAAPKSLVIVGGDATVSEALDVLPVPPLVDETVTLLFLMPDVVPVTFTVTVHVFPGVAIVPPVSDTLPDPATAVPPHVVVKPLGDATTRPAGKVSVNAIPLSAVPFAAGFVIVNVSEVVPFNETAAAPNALFIVGGATTSILAEAVPPVPPSVDVTLPVVLFCVPAAVPVTLTENVQKGLCASVAPVRLM